MSRRCNQWTPEQIATLRDLAAQPIGSPEIARRLGRSRGSITTKCSQLNLTIKPRPRPPGTPRNSTKLPPRPALGLYKSLVRKECALWAIDPERVFSRHRTRPCAYARARVFRKLIALGYNMNGTSKVAGCHHTTVLHALRRDDADDVAFLETVRDRTAKCVIRETPKRQRIVPFKPITHRYLDERAPW